MHGQKLQEAYNDYIKNYSVKKGLVKKSIKNKEDILDGLFPFLDGRPFDYKSANDYVSYKFAHGWTKPNSQVNIVKYLRAFVNFLFEYEYIEKNFAKKIIRPTAFPIPEPLPDIDQAEAVILAGTEFGKYDHAYHRERKTRMRFALQFALRTGVRGNELVNIRGKDLYFSDFAPDTSKVLLNAAKGGRPQWQPLPLDLLPELKKHTSDERVFPVAIKTCNIVLKRGAKIVGLREDINMDVHILRKVFGTTLSRYLTMAKVCCLMRHSSISVTQKFYITYGLEELGHDLNMNHPLIRIAVPADENIQSFINNIAYPYFLRNKEIQLAQEHNHKEREFILKFKY